MPRNGSGVYSAPANTKGVPNTTIESSRYNTFVDDLTTVLTGSVAADGQTPMTGALAMGSNKITGLAAGTMAADAATKQQMETADSALETSILGTLRGELNAPAGTKMLFAQAAAPTGWTLDAAQNDRVLRVSSSAGGGVGGSWTISGLTVQGHALTISQMPAHTHSFNRGSQNNNTSTDKVAGGITLSGTWTSTSAGGGAAHSHGLSADGAWRPAYVDAIICTKD